jgi:hypothetical protein
MKLKGISWIEQNVEKVVLGLMALVLVAVLATQFVLQPNSVDVGGGKRVPPGAIYEELARSAQAIEGQAMDPNPTLPSVSMTDLAARYDQAMQAPVSAAERLAGALGPAGPGLDVTATGPAMSGAIAGLAVPTPLAPIASSHWATLDPYAVAASPALQAVAPAQQPMDFASVSVQVDFDGTALRDALLNGSGGRPIPRKLWSQTGIAVLDVQAERQARQSDGSWGPGEAVVRLDGLAMPASGLSGGTELAAFVEVVQKAAAEQSQILQPAFPPTIAGLPWVAPREAAARGSVLEERTRVARLEAQITRVREEIERLRAGPTRTTTRPDSGGSSDPRSGGGGRRPGTGTDPAPNRPSGRDAQIERRTKELERLEKEREELKKPTGTDAAGDAGTPAARRDELGGPGAGLLTNKALPVWVHDGRAVPGAEYRYRVRIGVNNPLFGRGAVLDPEDAEQLKLAANPVVYSPWTDWTEPAEVGAREYLFVTSAGDAATGDGVRAAVDVYRMYYGFYRHARVSLEPGDSVSASLDVPPGHYTFDTAKLTREEAARAVEERAARLGAGAGGSGGTGSGRGVDDAGGSVREPLAAVPGLTSVADSLRVDLPYVMVAVLEREVSAATASGEAAPLVEVLFRGPEGEVVRRGIEERDGATETAETSAELGETARISFVADERGTDPGRDPGTVQDPYVDPRDTREPGRLRPGGVP